MVIRRDDNERTVAVSARPGGGFDAVAERRARAAVDVDAAVEEVVQISGVARKSSEIACRRLFVHAGNQQSRAAPPAQKIDAGFTNGILTVTIPKTEAAKETVKKISIKSA